MEESQVSCNEQVLIEEQRARMKGIPSKIVRVGSLTGLYGLVIVCVSTIFILSTFIGADHNSKPAQKIYPHVFNLILHTFGGIFIFTLYGQMHGLKRKFEEEHKQNTDNEQPQQLGVYNLSAFAEEDSTLNRAESMRSSSSSNFAVKGLTIEELRQRFSVPVHFDGEGASFFTRMGLLAFGLGATLLDGMRLMQFIYNPGAWDCYGGWYIAACSVNIFYHWIQIFFVLKFHKAVINVKHSLIAFGLVHLIATNMGGWISTIVVEGAPLTILTNETTNITEDYGKIKMFGCIREMTINDTAAPYLYPFVIEFSLLASSLIYRIFKNIGSIVIKDEKQECQEKIRPGEQSYGDCHKAHTGLFYGFIIFLGIMCSACLYIFYETQGKATVTLIGHPGIEITHVIYAGTSISTSLIALVTLLPTARKLYTLPFKGEQDCSFDQTLLVVAVVGYYMLFGLVAMAALDYVADSGDVGIMAKIVLSSSILECVQVTFQVVVLIDGLHRRACTATQEAEKPGRSLVSFHIIVNFGLWIINTFMLKSLHHLEMVSEFYGQTSWDILVKLFMPLSIFYRFHAAVCFADIWQNAYRREKSSTVRFLQIAQKMQDMQETLM